MPKYLVPSNATQLNKARHIPRKVLSLYDCHPPIFSALPNRNRILSQENHPPSLEYEVDSLFMPGLNLSAVKGIKIFSKRGCLRDE